MSKDLKDWENLEEKDIEALLKKLNILVFKDMEVVEIDLTRYKEGN